MAALKCKMCGGALEISDNQTVAVCEYCGTKQTLPRTSDEGLSNLFNRANDLRLRCEFDKAEQVYERIIEQDNTEAEAHWGAVLCRYGIEYVEDPKTRNRVPTCHRTCYEAVTADTDYLAAIANADLLQKSVYEEEARAIDEIQKRILSIVQNESPFDVFISYKETDENGKRTLDSTIANDIYYQLTQEGFKVFYSAITLEDKLGEEYEPYIFAALNTAKVMLVVGTKAEYFNAVWVKNEWNRFLKLIKSDRSRLLIPCYRNMDPYDLPDEFAHLQAQDMSKIGFIQDIIKGIKKVCLKEKNKIKPANFDNRNAAQTDNSHYHEISLDNGIYIGDALAGKPHGHGKFLYKNGDVYEGEWKFGERSGKGTLTYRQGGTFTSEWENDKIVNGVGREYDKNGYYEGEWKSGKRIGQGTYYWEKGGEWKGIWKDSKPITGSGRWYYEDGYYEGEMHDGKENGQGTYTWKNGGSWAGIWKDSDPITGSGRLYYEDGYYEGEMRDGEANGQGTIAWKDGGEWTGTWKDSDPITGSGRLYDDDGYYDGEMHFGKRSGQGTYCWEKGGEWTGTWENDRPINGSGIWRYDNGGFCEGNWELGLYRGSKIVGTDEQRLQILRIHLNIAESIKKKICEKYDSTLNSLANNNPNMAKHAKNVDKDIIKIPTVLTVIGIVLWIITKSFWGFLIGAIPAVIVFGVRAVKAVSAIVMLNVTSPEYEKVSDEKILIDKTISEINAKIDQIKKGN